MDRKNMTPPAGTEQCCREQNEVPRSFSMTSWDKIRIIAQKKAFKDGTYIKLPFLEHADDILWRYDFCLDSHKPH